MSATTHCSPRAAFDRVAGFSGVIVWSVLGLCVAVATAYDVAHWVTAW